MAVVAVVAVGFVIGRFVIAAHTDATRFVLAERPFVDPARAPHGLHILGGNGYDGQFFYRLALNPWNLHDGAYGFHFDTVSRLQRIGYPFLVWLVSGGRAGLVPYGLVLINVVGLAVLGWLGGILARDAGRHALYGLLIAGFFGFVFTLARDLSEIVAMACAVGGIVALRRGRWLLAGLALMYAGLSRETTLVVAAAFAITRIAAIVRRRARPGRPDAAWVLPAAGFAAWQAIVYLVRGQLPLSADAGANLSAPLVAVVNAVVHYLQTGGSRGYIAFAELVVMAAVVVLAAASYRTSTVPVHEKVAWLLSLALAIMLSKQVWEGYDDFRVVAELMVLSMLVLLGSNRRLRVPIAAASGAWVVVAAHWLVRI
jgi:hypothetical protein